MKAPTYSGQSRAESNQSVLLTLNISFSKLFISSYFFTSDWILSYSLSHKPTPLQSTHSTLGFCYSRVCLWTPTQTLNVKMPAHARDLPDIVINVRIMGKWLKPYTGEIISPLKWNLFHQKKENIQKAHLFQSHFALIIYPPNTLTFSKISNLLDPERSRWVW